MSADAPVALIEKNVVLACSPAARAEGVRRGMRQREAQARCPALHALPYDPALDSRVFEPVLTALEGALPGVHPVRPGMLAVRARGPARYYGGETAAALALLGTLAEHGVPAARAGIADGLFAAERAARSIACGKRASMLLWTGESAGLDIGGASGCRSSGIRLR